jgi:hypothetical protein
MANTIANVLGTALLATGLLASSADRASAAFVGAACTTSTGVSYNGAAYTACSGSYSGNLTPTAATSLLNNDGGTLSPSGVDNLLFGGITDWTYDKKINTGATPVIENGTNILGFNINPTGSGITSGQWGFTNANYHGPVVLELKGSTYVSYYYFASITGANSMLGNWNMAGVATNPDNGGNPGLSHASLFYSASANSVPEPLTILGSLAALGIGSQLRRTKKDSEVG